MSLFAQRDAYADFAEQASELRFSRPGDMRDPLVTIAIPTYKRHDELLEAIASAEAQLGDTPFEIMVLDNDPDPDASDALIARLPSGSHIPLRYYKNIENLGMFGNWNRCIELARGKWITLLNDDDLLYPQYLNIIMGTLNKRPEIDGIVCRKGYYYRSNEHEMPESSSIKSRIWDKLKRLRFDQDGVARVTPRNMFFGLELGNGLGFLFKKKAAIELGGYYPEDFPMSDGYFYVRYSVAYNLFWTHHILADIGIGENESMRPETLNEAVYKLKTLRETLIGKHVPETWRRLLPRLVANSIEDARRLWKVELDKQKFEREFNIKLPAPSYRKITLFRILHKAY